MKISGWICALTVMAVAGILAAPPAEAKRDRIKVKVTNNCVFPVDIKMVKDKRWNERIYPTGACDRAKIKPGETKTLSCKRRKGKGVNVVYKKTNVGIVRGADSYETFYEDETHVTLERGVKINYTTPGAKILVIMGRCGRGCLGRASGGGLRGAASGRDHQPGIDQQQNETFLPGGLSARGIHAPVGGFPSHASLLARRGWPHGRNRAD